MKKFILGISLVTAAFSLKAQSSIQCFALNNSGTATVSALTNGLNQNITTSPTQSNLFTNTFRIQMRNVGNTTNTYSLRRIDEVLGSGAEAFFCVAGNCYPPSTIVTPNGQGITITANSTYTDQLTVDITETNSAVFSRIRYKFTNIANPNDTLSFKLVYNNTNAVSIKELINTVASISDVMPNPANAKAFVNVQATSASECTIKCTNMLGSLMYQKTVSLNEGKNKVDVLNDMPLSDGVYFITVQQGNQSLTKRFVIQR
jgi:hypothetical protein